MTSEKSEREKIACPILLDKKGGGEVFVRFDERGEPTDIMCPHYYTAETTKGLPNGKEYGFCGLLEKEGVRGKRREQTFCTYTNWEPLLSP